MQVGMMGKNINIQKYKNNVTKFIINMHEGARLAKLNTNAVFDALSETVVLYPEDKGNLHCLTATTPCVVLDVMGPPYTIRLKEGAAPTSVCGHTCFFPSQHFLPLLKFSAKDACAGGDDGQYAWLKQECRTLDLHTFHLRPIIRK
ncbi:hypothetical protein EJB05_16083, partial [Eragrostis curvula]